MIYIKKRNTFLCLESLEEIKDLEESQVKKPLKKHGESNFFFFFKNRTIESIGSKDPFLLANQSFNFAFPIYHVTAVHPVQISSWL